MEGETYTSISVESEASGFSHTPIGFIHGKNSERRFFRVTVKRRVTRTNYLVQDVSGEGVLSTASVPDEQVSSFYVRLKRLQSRRSLVGTEIYVVGSIFQSQREYPMLVASSFGFFSFCTALQTVLG